MSTHEPDDDVRQGSAHPGTIRRRGSSVICRSIADDFVFFDFRDGDTVITDAKGVELETYTDARREAARVLACHAKDTLDEPIGYEESVVVRADGQPQFELTLSFNGRRIVPEGI